MKETADTTPEYEQRYDGQERSQAKKLASNFSQLLDRADIKVGGSRPWDLRFMRPEVVSRILNQGAIGLGEAYMDGAWDANQLDSFFAQLLRMRLDRSVKSWRLALHALRFKLLNLQTIHKSWRVGQVHYDLGNAFYQAMLGPSMAYTCGYWKEANTLDEAQDAKLDLICRKLELQPGMRLLDIGCGWGSLMAFAAKHYGVSCVGVTISKEQAEWCKKQYPDLPLEFRLQDYRTLYERFDRVASIGMFEHVGRKNYRKFMEVSRRCLEPNGLMLLHTIGKNLRNSATNPWVDKYIFPGGDLPSIGQIGDACDDLFIPEDLHNFGADYDKTLMAWLAQFEAAWPEFSTKLGGRFYRMWKYYLCSCAGAFRVRDIQLWQWVLSPRGQEGGYHRPLV